MKKVLIVSENFSKGGLETQIYTFYKKSLEDKKIKFIFAFGNYNSEWNFENSKVYENFNFNYSTTIDQFIDDVQRLIKIINENEIDVVHVHPFYCLFSAVIACHITQTPIIYSYHGFVSFNFPSNFATQYLFEYSIDNLVSHVLCIYKDISAYIDKKYRITDCTFLPNPINTKEFSKTNINNNGEWVYISRLSKDKIDGIKLLLNVVNSLNISKLHIYGSGEEEKTVKNMIRNKRLTNKVVLHNYSYNLGQELNGKYNGIFGMGRCAIEGIALGLPVCLIGYGKICGIIDDNLIEYCYENNFAPIFCKSISEEELVKQFKNIKSMKFDKVNKVVDRLDIDEIYEDYYNIIKNIQIKPNNCINDLYNKLLKISNKDQLFYLSNQINEILINTLSCQSINDSLKEFSIMYYENRSLENKILDLNLKYEDLLKKLESNEKEINNIMNKINIKTIIKNTINRIKKKKNN